MKGARLITKYTASTGSVYMPVIFDFGGIGPFRKHDHYTHLSKVGYH